MILEEKVMLAKKNTHSLNDLLSKYKPFIQKVVYDTCNRYVEWGRDEELSIGLIAFEEAVKRYDSSKGSFLALANRVIRSRVIDYLRKENKHFHTAIDEVQEKLIDNSFSHLLAEEIKELQIYLSKYYISFQNLPDVSPVKRKLRDELKKAAQLIAKENHLISHLITKNQLPVQAIAKEANISYKKIERNRIYLITMALIWYLDLPLLQGYIM